MTKEELESHYAGFPPRDDYYHYGIYNVNRAVVDSAAAVVLQRAKDLDTVLEFVEVNGLVFYPEMSAALPFFRKPATNSNEESNAQQNT